jgi:hypothetical protein
MRTMKRHTFRGKRWTIEATHRRGVCDGPHIADRVLRAPVDVGSRNALDTVIHEALHACLWDLDDEAVAETARDVARFLWRAGWRMQ